MPHCLLCIFSFQCIRPYIYYNQCKDACAVQLEWISSIHAFMLREDPQHGHRGLLLRFPESPHRFSEMWRLLFSLASPPPPVPLVSLTFCHGAVKAAHEDPLIYHLAADSGAWWLTEVMSHSQLFWGFPPEIRRACAGSKTTRSPRQNPTQHHPPCGSTQTGANNQHDGFQHWNAFPQAAQLGKILLRGCFCSPLKKAKLSSCSLIQQLMDWSVGPEDGLTLKG